MAVGTAITTMLAGGRDIAAGVAVVYGLIITVGCLTMALLQRGVAKRLGSSILALDAKTWAIDAALSAVVLAAFLAAWLIQGTSWEPAARYIDQVLVIVLGLFAVIMPIRVLLLNGRQLLLMAPTDLEREQVLGELSSIMESIEAETVECRVFRIGRGLAVWLIVVKPQVSLDVVAQDELRYRLVETLAASHDEALMVEVVQTQDLRWLLEADQRVLLRSV